MTGLKITKFTKRMTHSQKLPKRYVFNSLLKPVENRDLRKSNGSEFHSLGAHTEKALSP